MNDPGIGKGVETADRTVNWARSHLQAAHQSGRLVGCFAKKSYVPQEGVGLVLKDCLFVATEVPAVDPDFDVRAAARHADILGEV